MPGKFIVFEGGEGSGKTTQLLRTQEWLRSNARFQQLKAHAQVSQVIVTREPGGTTLGTHLRQVLLQHQADEPIYDRTELLLYAADRAQHVAGFLLPCLATGSLILCDRYTDSTVAYQGYGRGLDLALIDQLNQIATQGLQSDLTLWLDVEPEVGLHRIRQRGVSDRIEQVNLEFHQRVRQGFVDLAEANPHRIQRIDASLSEDQVAQQIQDILIQRLMQWYPALSLP